MFNELLDKIVARLDGVRGCMLLDADSIPLAERYVDEDPDEVQVLAIELNTLVWLLQRRASEDAVLSRVESLTLRTASLSVLCRMLDEGLTLLIALSPEADVQRGETMLSILSPWVSRQLA